MQVIDLEGLLARNEDEHLEFKEAKRHFDFEELTKYCVALANEGGGMMILGVTDKRPRRIVGSSAFASIERTKAGLIERLHLRIELEELPHPDGRVLVFTIPSRPRGMPIEYKGAYYMRSGGDLVPMLPDMIKRILDEAGPDFSAEICHGVSFEDLDAAALEDFKARWLAKSGNHAIKKADIKQLLIDSELVVDGGITYAALVLFGSHAAMNKHLPQAETIFEYRSSDASGPAQQRETFSQGFFTYYDELSASFPCAMTSSTINRGSSSSTSRLSTSGRYAKRCSTPYAIAIIGSQDRRSCANTSAA